MWLPDNLHDELLLEAAHEIAAASLFRRMLKEYDPDLELGRAREHVTHPELKPGYWFILRAANPNVGREPGLWIIQEPDGSYCEPRMEHFERLKQKDSWARPGLYHDYRKRMDERERQGEKRNEELHREFREKLDERVRALNPSLLVRTNVADLPDVSPDAPMPARQPKTDEVHQEAARRLAELNAAPELPDTTVPEAGAAIDDSAVPAPRKPNRAERRKARRNPALVNPGWRTRQRGF